ncbi:BTAD domain-containing putative transcriptional regulator [Nonomuraea typhae]|uniref:BTAD domain-containing putative transcriptional regulator n=1 Tax=Nonomuraea typhae TaxID=2603600 RepID=A0ABW7YQR0_9ACTN
MSKSIYHSELYHAEIYHPEVAASTRLSLHALGPFRADRDGRPLDLGGLRQLAVLARLLVARGRAVPVSTLVDEIWPGRPPAQPLASIQGYVSRLRRALEPDRAPRQEARVLVNAAPGYALRAEADQVDAWRFEALVRGGPGEPRQVWADMETALALWRGPALAELANLPWAATESARLEELRLVALERHADAGIRLGTSAALVPDLEAHAAAHPLREEAWRLLAGALYGSGRLGDALGALRRARALWREELGLDLSPGLRGLEADFLAQRPAVPSWLPGQRRPPTPPVPSPPVPSPPMPGPPMPGPPVSSPPAVPVPAHDAHDAYDARDPHAAHGAHDPHAAHGAHDPHAAHGAHDPHAAHGAHDSHAAHGAHVPRVLVADDQALVRAGLRVVLDAEPDVRFAGEAADGEEAVAAVLALRPDVVLLDIQMPRMDGVTSARRILAGPRPPKVIMLTTFGSDENLYAALRAGVSGFILKTSPPEQLVAAVRAAAAGDALIDPAVTTGLIAAFAHRLQETPPPATPVETLATLPEAQVELVRLVARGLSDGQIAGILRVPDAGALVGDLLARLNLGDRAQLVVLAYESGLVTPGLP